MKATWLTLAALVLAIPTSTDAKTRKRRPRPHPVAPLATDAELRVQALNSCWRHPTMTPARIAVVDRLFEIEAGLGFEGEDRGLMVAASCWESGYKWNAVGDKRTTRTTSVAIVTFDSWGTLQHSKTHAKHIRKIIIELGDDPDDWEDPRLHYEAAAYYWGQKYLKNKARVEGFCEWDPEEIEPFGTLDGRVVAAGEATSVRKPKCSVKRRSKKTNKLVCVRHVPRCRQSTEHWWELQRWRAYAEALRNAPTVTSGGIP